MEKFKYIIGIDEVGRGPLAGPVTVAAVAAPVNLKFKIKNLKLKLRDSKKLTSKQREAWFKHIKKHPQIFYATASFSPKTIDKINVSNAANLAATKALKRLIENYELRIKNYAVYLDGALYLQKKSPNSKFYILNSRTIIRGDEKIPAIALASIVAKVSRDRVMLQLHKKYPKYGFDKHKGYGTKKHIKAIKKHGLTPIHRRSFRIKN